MTDEHDDYKFSVTIHTDDLPLVYCLRGLSVRCQETGNSKIPHGGTKDPDWKRHGQRVTFHFSGPYYRDNFVHEIERLFPQGLWEKIGASDNDPAKKQS